MFSSLERNVITRALKLAYHKKRVVFEIFNDQCSQGMFVEAKAIAIKARQGGRALIIALNVAEVCRGSPWLRKDSESPVIISPAGANDQEERVL